MRVNDSCSLTSSSNVEANEIIRTANKPSANVANFCSCYGQ